MRGRDVWRALSLRLAGAGLLAIAALAATRLAALAHDSDPTTMPLAYLLAAIVFGSASAGAALLIHGRHLFDPVRVAGRWARQTVARRED